MREIDVPIIIKTIFTLIAILIIFACAYSVYQHYFTECVEERTVCYKYVGTGGPAGGVAKVEIGCGSSTVEARENVCVRRE